ncbi:MAG: fliJ [Burkholderiaceae bacterium]|nr:fliJ [Burkholderiaceae bacterium]
MSISSALATLIELATKDCDHAAQELGKAIRMADESEKKLALLLQYREDYSARFQTSQAEGLTIAGYRNFQLFMDKLDQAIDGQQHVVNESKKRIEEHRTIWQAAEKKRVSYDTLATRERKEAQRKEARREQKQMDEFANRKSHQKHK